MTEMKRKVQSELRKAYWKYIESIFSNETSDGEFDNMKKFWRFIKHNKKDNTCISELRYNNKRMIDPRDKGGITKSAIPKSIHKGDTGPSRHIVRRLTF